jgi:hypothetical protein
MRDYRQQQKDQQVEAQRKPRRQELCGLFESSPEHIADAYGMLLSAQVFAHRLDIQDIQPGESLESFGIRVFEKWKEVGFPLLTDGPRPELVLLEGFSGSLPILWPADSDQPLDLKTVYWAEDLKAMSDRIQAHWLNRKETYWRWNSVTKYYEPIQVFKRPDPRDELADARLGYRWQIVKEFNHPMMIRLEGLAASSQVMRSQDLVEIMNSGFTAAMEEIQRRQQ